MQQDPSELPGPKRSGDSGDAEPRPAAESSAESAEQAPPKRYAPPPTSASQGTSRPRYAPPPEPPPLSGQHPHYAPPQPATVSEPHDAENEEAPADPPPASRAASAMLVPDATDEPTLDSVVSPQVPASPAEAPELRRQAEPRPVESVEAVGMKSARENHVASPPDPRATPLVTPGLERTAGGSIVPEDTDDATLVQARKPRATRWSLIAGEQRIPLYTRNLVGRQPSSPRGYDAELIALKNDTKTVSKTHARLEVEGSTLWITDMQSTNGTYLSFDSDEGPAYQECEPGDDYEVREGDTITLGDYELQVKFDAPE